MSVLKRAGVKCPGSRLDDCTRDCRHLGIEVAFGVAQHACRAGHDRRCLRSRGAPIPGILCRADPQQKPIAVEALPVVGTAMAQAGVVGIGRLTLSRRERMVMVEPRGTGMALFALRAADEVRAPQFGSAEGDLDAEMVAIAGAIIRQRTGNFDPSTYRDRYQEALQQLIEAKMKGVTIEPRAV